jgi:hypothetical protein
MSNLGAPSVVTKEIYCPPVAGGADLVEASVEAPFAGTVTKVQYLPQAAMTGDNTNARTFTLINKGQAGLGTTVVATLAMTTGVNGVAFDEKDATLSVVANAVNVAAGDILAWSSVHTGTGIADPGGRVQVEFTRADSA